MFDPTIFYNSYLEDYHKFKAITLKSILDNPMPIRNLYFRKN